MQVYLDNSATTCVSKRVALSVSQAMTDNYGNPSSLHTKGQSAEKELKNAREKIASSISAKPGHIVFTSGGTESDNLAFRVLSRKIKDLDNETHSADVARNADANKKKRIIISSIEHPAVAQTAAYYESLGFEVCRIPVAGAKNSGNNSESKSAENFGNKSDNQSANKPDSNASNKTENNSPGLIDIKTLENQLDENVVFVSVMHVNNEIGTIQPIEDIGNLIKARNKRYDSKAFFHCDAVQSYAKIPIDVSSNGFANLDFLSISSHKIHGPKGVGAIYSPSPARIPPLIFGGGQESGIRSGTENVPGIIGFAEAAEIETGLLDSNAKHVSNLRKILLDGISHGIDDIIINSPKEASLTGEPGKCSPYILNVSFLGTRGEVLVHSLEQNGIFVSTGSACSSIGKSSGKDSETLISIGLTPKEAEGTLRFSLSRYNTEEEMYYVLENLEAAVKRYRKIGSFR